MTKDEIIALLERNDTAIARALVVLNERQTQDEQNSKDTRDHNGRGFRPCDAFMGTSLANFYTAKGFLTPKQLNYFKKKNAKGKMRIACYARQLVEIAEEKARLKKINDRDAA